MKKIAVLGLGNMGGAIFNNLKASGFAVKGWTRSGKSKYVSYEVEDLSKVIDASDLIIICVSNYDAVRSVLSKPDVVRSLSGKTVLNFTTGNAVRASNEEKIALTKGYFYLDAKLLCYPDELGRPDTKVLVSGNAASFESCHEVLKSLGGDVAHLGENIGMAATWDLAILNVAFGSTLSMLHSLVMCKLSGIPLSKFAESAAVVCSQMGFDILAKTIESDGYNQPRASVEVWLSVLKNIEGLYKDLNLDPDYPKYITTALRDAQEKGLGQMDHAILFETLLNQNYPRIAG